MSERRRGGAVSDRRTTLIGIEEHWILDDIDRAQQALPPGRRDDSLALNEHGDGAARLRDIDGGRVAAMDEQGVDLQVLSLAPPATQGLERADAVALSRAANDRAAAAVAAHPGRLRAMATLPLADPAAAAAELERAAGLGLVGAMVYGRTGEVPLDAADLDNLWTVAESLEQPIFIHPQIPPTAVRTASYSGIGQPADLALATFGWGWHLEAGTAALRLMASGTLDRHPALQLVLGHWGELLLFWHERADGIARMAGLQRSITEYLRENVWITASGMLDPAMLRHALSVTTPDRLLFSTDYPFQRPTGEQIAAFLAELPTDADRDAFAFGNARRLFHISTDTTS
jgi:predicted TIM-barrel fold metal-dependent hydrolase